MPSASAPSGQAVDAADETFFGPAASAYANATPMIVRSPTRVALPAVLLVVASLSVACDASEAPAEGILRRTVPHEDARPTISGPTRSGQSIQFTWDFQTHLTPTAYSAWLPEQLRDFELVPGDGPQLRLSKHLGGDSYRLLVTAESDGATTHVHVQLTESPD